MSSSKAGQGAGNGCSVTTIVLVMSFILATLGTAVLSQEVAEKPQKPRYEKTELVLKDNRSGLVWTLNANVADRQFTWSGAFDGIERVVNKDRVAGSRDWRVPTREELLTLVELVREQGYDGRSPERTVAAGLASLGFQNVQEDAYWSSTENRYFSAEAWAVDMKDGSAAYAEKTIYYNLWPVRTAR